MNPVSYIKARWLSYKQKRWLSHFRFMKGDILIANSENFFVIEPAKNIKKMGVGMMVEMLEDQGPDWIIKVHRKHMRWTGTVIAAHYRIFDRKKDMPKKYWG